jgi:DnaJ-class molecular chaperone
MSAPTKREVDERVARNSDNPNRCPECRGSGVIIPWTGDNNPAKGSPCHVCRGTGLVEGDA